MLQAYQRTDDAHGSTRLGSSWPWLPRATYPAPQLPRVLLAHTCRGIQTGRIIICRGQGEEEEALHHQPFFSRTSTLRSCPKTQA